jgi:voltage-gated potassium channel
LRRRLAAVEENLTSRPDAALVDILRIPEPFVSPTQRIIRRIIYATLALFAAVLIVYLDRDGYRDVQDNQLSFLDCLYYATVSLSTTGYGDVTPFTPTARLINVLVITPLRIAFLIVLIGTTVETLTTQSRQALKIQRWRSRVRNHTVVVGYGTKGRTAVSAMVGDEVAPADIVVVDENATALERAKSAGWSPFRRCHQVRVLRLASANTRSRSSSRPRRRQRVAHTLTARELAPTAKIIRGQEAENRHLLRQSGADSTVVSSETADLVGHSHPDTQCCGDDGRPVTPDAGFALAEREVPEGGALHGT